jgi:Tol biopolymer transport system component
MSHPNRFRVVLSLLGIAAFTSTVLIGCQQFTSPSPFPSTPSPTLPAPNTPAPSPLPGAPQQPILVSVEEAGYAHLFLFSPETSTLTRLTYGKWSDITPALSPDGKRVAFASNRGGQWDLYTLDVVSGETTRLTNTPQYDSSPSWSPDLAWIAFETYQDGSLDIAILSLTDP